MRYIFVRMLRYSNFILYLSLLQRLTICSNVKETAPSSQDLVTEGFVANANFGRNFTEQVVHDKDALVFPVRNTTVLNDIKNVEDEPWDLDQLLEVWNPVTLSRFWRNDTYRDAGISFSCNDDLTRYMMGVSKKTNWALKMMDADGKRTWGTFSGNRYWFGAVDQCRKMEAQFMEWQKSEILQRSEEFPPFRISLNAINLAVEVLQPGLNKTYNVTVGLCIPIACDIQDVQRLLYFVQNQSMIFPFRITIDHIRNLSKGYTLWGDTTFHIILISFIVVCVFVIIGTVYDIVMRYRILREEGKKINNNNNIVTGSKLVTLNGLNFNEITSLKYHEITIQKLLNVTVHNGSLDVRNPDVVPKPLSEALLSFSLLVNMFKVCSLNVGADTLAPIHGLRFYTMLWIILAHTCMLANEVSDNQTYREEAENDFLYQIIGNGTYSVDTYFFMSGCLVTFLYYRTIVSKKLQGMKIIKGCHGQVLQFLSMMWYRYFRLTPLYLLVIGLIQVSTKWYHDHSILELTTLDYQTCEKFWWRNALYINTYFDMDERCITWSWYLANDTQFYTVGIMILIIGASFLPIAAFMVVFFLITSWITTAIITLNSGHMPSIQDPFANYASLYDKPWMRIGPYLVGMITGWYLFKIDCKANMNKVVVAVGWFLSLAAMASIVCGLHAVTFGPVLSALYTSLSHSAWAVCLAWILIACVTGYGGIADYMLSCKYLYPFSRLTYCTYLIHPMLMRILLLRNESSWHLTHDFMAYLFLGLVVISYAVSLFLSLLFEAPMVSLLRIVHPLREWKFR